MPTKEQKKIIETSMKRFNLSVEAERDHRTKALADLKFRAGEQWPADAKAEREKTGKPCLTLNFLPASERQILNEQRQNRPSIQIHPIDDKADIETARVFQGLCRHIEVDSSADAAYDTATAAQVRTGGPGWFRVTKEYESPFSMNQVLKIKRIRNHFMVYCDPNANEPDRSDMKFLHSFCDYSKDEYEAEFGEKALASLGDLASVGDSLAAWMSDDNIRVVEYWYIDSKKDTLYVGADMAPLMKSKLGEDFDEETDQRIGRDKEGNPISRGTTIPVVKQCIHNAKEVLEENEWEGRWIPFIPALGDELDVDGKLILEGMVRHVKDAMQMDNVMASKQMESIGLIPKAKFLIANGQVKEYKAIWDNAHVDDFPYLPYDPMSLDGTAVPPPTPITFEPAVQAITEARMQLTDARKAILGIYDAQLGARSNENSGRGILARKQQGELGNFHYVDNLTRAIRHLGRILIDLIPKIYDTARVLRIIGEDGTPDTVMVNGSQLPQNDPRLEGVKHMYDLGVGTYDVTVSAGPSYQTKRMEAVASQLDFVKALPPQTQVLFLDLIAGNMDWPQSEKFAERAKKALPPGMADDDENAEPIPPQAKQQLVQQQQMIAALTERLNAATEIVQTKKLEMDTKLEIEKLKIEAQIGVAEITTKAQSESERAQFLTDLEQTLLNHGHEYAMMREKHGHEANQAAVAQAHTADMAQQAQVAEKSQPDGA